MSSEQKASITIQAYDKASYAVLGVASNLETLNKKLAKQSQLGYAFGQLGQQLAPTWGKIQNMGAAWGAAFRRISMAGVAVGGATAGMVGFAKSAADAADKINDLSSRYQIGSETLQLYGTMVAESGGSFDDAATSIGKLKKAMNEAINGDKESAAAFAGIGISVAKLKKMKPEEVMLAMADAFKGSEKDMAKQAVLLQLMGKNGTVFMDTMNKGSGELQKKLEQMRRDGRILSDQQKKDASSFADSWDRMSGTLEGVKNKLGIQLAARLQPLLDKFQTWLAGEGGQKLAESFDRIFTSENIESFVDALKGLAAVVWGIGKAFVAVFNALGPTLTVLLGASIVLAPLASAFVSTASAMASVVKAAFAISAAFPAATAAALVAGGVIYAAIEAYQAYKRLSETQDQVAKDTAVRNDKRAAYDRVLRGVGGEALIDRTKNMDFQGLDSYVQSYEKGGLVAQGTAAKLAALPVDVSGKMEIEVTAAAGASAKITELKKYGAMDFEASAGLAMVGS